jgi:hypothetical protein
MLPGCGFAILILDIIGLFIPTLRGCFDAGFSPPGASYRDQAPAFKVFIHKPKQGQEIFFF